MNTVIAVSYTHLDVYMRQATCRKSSVASLSLPCFFKAVANWLTGKALSLIHIYLSASSVPPDFLHALDYYVREQGGGLLMCGVRHSFGSGGDVSSPIDELLPVSMEMKKDKMKLMTAMSIVLDLSLIHI